MVVPWAENHSDHEDSEQSVGSIFSSGIAPDYLATLEVTGRKSGRAISFPVVVAVLDGQRYLVSILGNHSQWVQNA
jgi:hypothetical protein